MFLHMIAVLSWTERRGRDDLVLSGVCACSPDLSRVPACDSDGCVCVCVGAFCLDTCSDLKTEELLAYMTLTVVTLSFLILFLRRVQPTVSVSVYPAPSVDFRPSSCSLCERCSVNAKTPSSGLPAFHLSATICKGLFKCDRLRASEPPSSTLFA